MKNEEKVQRAFSFLLEHAKSGDSFRLEELVKVSKWTKGTASIYLGKKFSDLVEKKNGVYHVTPEMLRVRYEDFKDLYRQKQRLFTDYVLKVPQKVLVYEFFMPLSREDRLREALDNLFYKDTVEQRIKEIGIAKIRKELKLPESSSDSEVVEFVIGFMNNTIGGYSLHLVNGRFRAGTLTTRHEMVARPLFHGPYLVDETTAVVRFILPVSDNLETPTQMNLFEPAKNVSDSDGLVEQMRWLFLHFFAEAVTRVVKKEDEIWLLESGMRSALYRWVRKSEQ
ncbi:MAG TPA: hypothetical protein PKE62_10225 [Anaerolineales bacterium]|nr:hypothetical protein [Anaerolineales bacterium]